MAAMRYYGNIMTTTIWRLRCTVAVADVFYIFNSTVVDWTCFCNFFCKINSFLKRKRTVCRTFEMAHVFYLNNLGVSHSESNGRVWNEYWIGRGVEGSSNNLISLAIPEFAWRHSGKVRKVQSQWPIYLKRVETGNCGIIIRSVASRVNLLAD